MKQFLFMFSYNSKKEHDKILLCSEIGETCYKAIYSLELIGSDRVYSF